MRQGDPTLTYPNGLLKSDLLDLYLSAADFGCSQADYNYEVQLAQDNEAKGVPICRWRFDEDDLIVVDDLALQNPFARIVVLKDGFRLMRQRSTGLREVFISYGREDEGVADFLAYRLRLSGFMTWRDKESLFAGQPWKLRIDEAIDRSEFFLALVSTASASREGYVHAELRHALERQRKMPEARAFIVPVRLDCCEMPHASLREFHYLDLFPNISDGTVQLINALTKANQRSG